MTILEVLGAVEGHRHLTAKDVYEVAADRLPGLNVTTVYRTLEGLHAAGLVDTMICSHDQARFALRHPGHRHGHLLCRHCGEALTLPIELVAEWSIQVKDRFQFQVDEDHLTLSGTCRRCAQ